MALRIGTQLISPVRIQDDTIPEPVAFSNEIQGGAQSGATLSNRDATPVYFRQFGMFYTVYNDSINNGTYILKYGKTSTDLSDNGNWDLFAGAAGNNVKKIDQSILNTGSINLPANCILYMILINAAAELLAGLVGYTSGIDNLVMTQDMPAGFNAFTKGIYIPSPTTIFFAGINVQSTCSAIIFQF